MNKNTRVWKEMPGNSPRFSKQAITPRKDAAENLGFRAYKMWFGMRKLGVFLITS